MRSAGLRDLAYLAESRSYDVCVPIKLTSKRTFNLSLMSHRRHHAVSRVTGFKAANA